MYLCVFYIYIGRSRYSGYAGLGLGNPSSTTYFGDVRDQYGVDWEVLTRAGLTVAMVGYGQPNITDTKRLLRRGGTQSGAVPPLVCGAIGGTQAEFAERYHSCDGVMEYDGDKPFDSGLGFHVRRGLLNSFPPRTARDRRNG